MKKEKCVECGNKKECKDNWLCYKCYLYKPDKKICKCGHNEFNHYNKLDGVKNSLIGTCGQCKCKKFKIRGNKQIETNENLNKCLNCNCAITRSNQGITRKNFKYSLFNCDEVICLKCYNLGVDFNNLKGGKK